MFNPQYVHKYSVLATWEFQKGSVEKKVLCIKNPCDHGNNVQKKFNFQSLKQSLQGFPELIELNNKYFCS